MLEQTMTLSFQNHFVEMILNVLNVECSDPTIKFYKLIQSFTWLKIFFETHEKRRKMKRKNMFYHLKRNMICANTYMTRF